MNVFQRQLPSAAAWSLMLLCITGPLSAQPMNVVAPTYESLLQQLETFPSQRETAALYEASLGRLDQSKTISNPVLTLEVDNFLGTGERKGFGGSETTLSATQPIENPSKRRARIAVAGAQVDATANRGEDSRWRAAARLAQAYVDAEAAIARHALATEGMSLAEAETRAVAALVREGREAKFREIQAQSELASVRSQLDEASANRAIALARLAAIVMRDQPIEALGSSLLNLSPSHLSDGTTESPQIRIARAETLVADKQVTFEKRRAMPDFSVTLGLRHFANERDAALVAGVGITIPIFDRNTGNIRAAAAELRAAEARQAAVELEVRAEKVAADAAMFASQSRVNAARVSVSTAREAYRLSRIGVDAGRISQLELRASRAALVSALRSEVDAKLARANAEIQLAQIEGRLPFGVQR